MVNKNLSHAYIYTGEDCVSLLERARADAKEITESIADVIEVSNERYGIREADMLLLETIRAVVRDLYLVPYGEKKVIIFPDASKLTVAGQNALLKSLEEPPEYAVFILVVENTESLLPTVHSRVQVKRFNGGVKEITGSIEGLEAILEGLFDEKSVGVYKAIEFLNNQKSNSDLVFSQMIMFFRKKMLSNLQKGDKLLVGGLVRMIEACERAHTALGDNANYNMTITRLILDGWEDFNKNARGYRC